MIDKIILKKELKYFRNEYKQKSIVLCHGVFDVVHLGHINHFKSAKKNADILLVSITADKFIKKGPSRPLFDESSRVQMLSQLNIVDRIFISENETCEELIDLLKPNYYAKGIEYKDSNLQKNLFFKEKKALKRNNVKLIFTEDKKLSSTKIINIIEKNISTKQFGIFNDEQIEFLRKKLNENIFHSKHLDIYDVSKDGFEDIVLIKNCYFFICDTAGIANIATLFNIPVLRHNWIPISNSSSYRTLIIPKLIKNKVTGQFVEYKKIFKDFAKGDIYKMRSSQFYIDNELDIIDNETDILIESTKEMYKRIEFNFDFDFDDNLQKNFESWLKDYDIYNPGLLPKSFKEKYEKLIT
tara:strand:- start:740 stop:1804 length:1065 start_codon:yes stop_codon:yes gene_type:complete